MTLSSLFSGPLRYLPSVGAFMVLAWLILSPHPLPDNHIKLWEGADKMAHALMFGGVTVVMLSDAFRRRPLNFPVLLLIVALGVALGYFAEIAQRYMNLGRQAEQTDFIADAIGVVAASGAWIIGRCSHR